MTDELAQLMGFAEGAVWVAALVFFRVGAAAALLPVFGEQVVPARVKLGAALAFTMIVIPTVWGHVSDQMVGKIWLGLVAGEVVVGLTLGIIFRLFVLALQIAGSIAAQSTSLSQLFGAGLGNEPQPSFSTILVVGGLCLAAMSGLHVRVAEAFMLSYELFPAGTLPLAADLSEWGVQKIGHFFAFGFTLAAPFVIASVVYNLALGAINKAMPQLMVAFVGAPAISLGALIMLLLASPIILSVWLNALWDGTDLLGGAF